MPTYELVLLLKKMDVTALKTVLTRNAKYVLESGGNLRKMENLGHQTTPFAIVKQGRREHSAHYFLFNYDANIQQNREIHDKFKRDLDVLKSTSFVECKIPGEPLQEKPKLECTLHEDLLPPPYRPSVVKLLQQAEKVRNRKQKKKFKFNTGLDYSPI